MKKLLIVLVLGVMGLSGLRNPVFGNNVRTVGETQVRLNATRDSLLLTFTLSWDNSWRDEYNWDAVWLFVKAKKQDMGGMVNDWWHLALGKKQAETPNLKFHSGNTGNYIMGVFAYPKNKGHFDISGEQVTLRASLAENGLSVEDIDYKRYFFTVSGIEMVMIPYGPFYLGDNFSKGTFCSLGSTTIRPEDDIIGTDPGFTYSGVPSTYYKNMSPAAAANRENNPRWIDTGDNIWYPNDGAKGTDVDEDIQWIVNFGTPKTIRTFGVSWGVDYIKQYKTYYAPTKTWYLQGCNDSLNWVTLSTMSPDQVYVRQNSYPVQDMIRVDNPGAYKYYRLFLEQTTKGYDCCELANVAMSEEDLFEKYTTAAYVISDDWEFDFGRDIQWIYSKDGTESGTLLKSYPKGYAGFYIMKYEVSQEQYVNFLNMLTYKQQKNRIGNNLDVLTKGQYVFGDPNVPSARNGIVLFEKEVNRPAVFANNLNPAMPCFAPDDGQTLACNYMTPDDMLAYLDWAGLRPLSELEYEKAARAPQRYTPGEYAWNTTAWNPLPGIAAVANQGQETEMATDIDHNVNAGGHLSGPVRCGAFARPLPASTNQEQAGASYYGVMELSGNLSEMYYSIRGGSEFVGLEETNLSHGDGVINFDGTSEMTKYWPAASTPEAFIVKGGNFMSGDSLLRISDRSVFVTDPDRRDSTMTFRGGRSMLEGLGGGGEGEPLSIERGETVACVGESLKIMGDPRPEEEGLKVRYMWWVRAGKGPWIFLPDETGKDLSYSAWDNAQSDYLTYWFERDVIYGTGWEASSISIKVPNTEFSWGGDEAHLGLCSDPESIGTGAYQLGGEFEWSYMGDALTANVVNSATATYQYSNYYPARSDFGTIPSSGMVADVTCSYTIDRCKTEHTARIYIEPYDELCPALAGPDADGNFYAAGVVLGCRCWMRENINVGNFVWGNTGVGTYGTVGIQKWCYANDENYCEYYGGLYNWDEAVSGGLENEIKYVNGDPNQGIQGICPNGWHIPDVNEWNAMVKECGTNPAKGLKNENDWGGSSYPGTNSTGMNMQGGGCLSGTSFQDVGRLGMWWTSTASSSSSASRRYMSYNSYAVSANNASKTYGYSVRCVKN